MKKRYTKKFILEAIAYWNEQLIILNEAQTGILNALEKEFGNRIYNDEEFIPTSETMNKIFDILNKTLFSRQLPKIDVLCMTESQLQELFDKHNYKGYKASDLYAAYIPLPDWKLINHVKKCQMPPVHYMVMNISQSKPMNLSFAINSLCHEMIHYLDTIKGDVLFKVLKAHRERSEFEDEHSTDIFKKKTEQFNKQGMTIMPNGNDEDIQELSKLSSYRMRKLQETEKRVIDADSNAQSYDFMSKVQVNPDGTLGMIVF